MLAGALREKEVVQPVLVLHVPGVGAETMRLMFMLIVDDRRATRKIGSKQ